MVGVIDETHQKANEGNPELFKGVIDLPQVFCKAMKAIRVMVSRKESTTKKYGSFDDRPIDVNTIKKECKVQVTTQELDLCNAEMNVVVCRFPYVNLDMYVLLMYISHNNLHEPIEEIKVCEHMVYE